MKLVNISGETAERWNAFVAQWPDFGLMQSYEWGTFKEAMGWKVIRLAVEQDGRWVAGAQVLVKPLPLGLASIAYVPRGPLVHWEDEAVARALLSAMHSAARRYRAISLKIEPVAPYSAALQQRLESYGFRRNALNNQPQCTMLIDLTPDTDTILAGMHKTTRYNIRYSARQGVAVDEGHESGLNNFCQLMEHTAMRAGFPARSQAYYRREWEALAPLSRLKLFTATYQGEVLAVRMPAAFAGKAATLHSASYDAHRNLKPNELLMWESIQWAKSQGCTTYDVWGIPNEVGEHLALGKPLPEERKGGLWGVYDFKRGFGGEVVYYAGTYDYIYSKPLHWLMNSAVSLLGSVDRLAQLGDRLNLRPEQPVGM